VSSYLQCTCNAGFFNASVQTASAVCQNCLAGSYCTGGGAIQACTGNASSPTQSASNASCTCNLGYKGIQDEPCVPCSSPYYCYNGLQAQCPTGSYSLPLSWTNLNCSCIAGRYGPEGKFVRVCLRFLALAHIFLRFLALAHIFLRFLALAHIFLRFLTLAHIFLRFLALAHIFLRFLAFSCVFLHFLAFARIFCAFARVCEKIRVSYRAFNRARVL
jgi:hypothetical protein